jgi:4-diphosphocytidyl-2C-methyl-D-erythritol kinase
MTQRLEEGGALLAQMSGSGSVVFGVFEDATRRDTVANDLGAEGIRVIRSRTCAHVEPILPIE